MPSHDRWFDKWNNNIWVNELLIRVTNRCNERCSHCCFRSGPECVGQLSTQDCELLNVWSPSRVNINTMGGELTILDDYPEMLMSLASGRKKTAIVTNGQWCYDKQATQKFLASVDAVCGVCEEVLVGISNDKWHQKFGRRALRRFREHGSSAILIQGPEVSDDKLLPIGRAWDNGLAGKVVEACCGCCQETGQLTVIETGMITLCPLGYFPWKHFSDVSYDEAKEHIWKWRAKQLDAGMDCFSCMEQDKKSLPK